LRLQNPQEIYLDTEYLKESSQEAPAALQFIDISFVFYVARLVREDHSRHYR